MAICKVLRRLSIYKYKYKYKYKNNKKIKDKMEVKLKGAQCTTLPGDEAMPGEDSLR